MSELPQNIVMASVKLDENAPNNMIQIVTVTGIELTSKIKRLEDQLVESEADAARLNELVESVEWVAGSDEDMYCAWCGGRYPGTKPERDWYESDEEYQDELEDWNRHPGHKADCPRQAALQSHRERVGRG